MTNSTNLILPFIDAAQAQKHVTHNAGLQVLDAVVQLAVVDRDLTAPPGSPTDGARYIVASGATGAWATKDFKIAAWQDGAWAFYTPREGWLAWVSDENLIYVYDGAAWGEYGVMTDNGASWKRRRITQLTTLSGAFTNAATQIPIGTVAAVSMRVTTTITGSGGAATFRIGDGDGTGGTVIDRFGNTLAFASGSTNRGHIGPTGYYSAANLRFTPDVGSFTGGVVRTVTWYDEFTPPTS